MTVQFEQREIGNLVIEGIPEIPEALADRVSQYLHTRSAAAVDWLPNGNSLLITTDFGETNQFHVIERAGGYRRQVTFFDEPVSSGHLCPDPQREKLLFTKDIGGNESYQLFDFDLTTGKYQLLTDGSSKNVHAKWNKKGDRFAFSSTGRNTIDHDIFIQSVDHPGKSQLVWEGNGYWYPIDWSEDDRYLTIGHFLSINDCRLFVLDLKSGEIKEIREDASVPIAYRFGQWSKDGRYLYFCSDYGSDFLQLKRFDFSDGSFIDLCPEISWDVTQMQFSRDGSQLAFVTNEAGIARFYVLDVPTLNIQSFPSIPEGQINGLAWHPYLPQIALTLDTPVQPSDVYVLDLNSKQLAQWTFSEAGGLHPQQFISPKLIHYPTFDTVKDQVREIPAFYYHPNTQKEKVPVLIYIHGGPESQYCPIFSPTFQFYLQELGVAVIAPNVRGSLGYGKRFVQLDNGFKREDSVKDIGALLDWIESHPRLDSQKVGVIGGSYGGYMVLASMTHFNDRLRCGVDIVGISNFVTFLENTKSYRRELRRVEYGDERDPHMRKHLEAISPTTNAHKINKPMLIVQGLNDPRVPASEAEQMVNAIRKNGGLVWYLLAKDEGHGFRKKSNRDYYTKAVMLFLQQFLLPS